MFDNYMPLVSPDNFTCSYASYEDSHYTSTYNDDYIRLYYILNVNTRDLGTFLRKEGFVYLEEYRVFMHEGFVCFEIDNCALHVNNIPGLDHVKTAFLDYEETKILRTYLNKYYPTASCFHIFYKKKGDVFVEYKFAEDSSFTGQDKNTYFYYFNSGKYWACVRVINCATAISNRQVLFFQKNGYAYYPDPTYCSYQPYDNSSSICLTQEFEAFWFTDNSSNYSITKKEFAAMMAKYHNDKSYYSEYSYYN